jgi:DNA gyrase subunit A
MVITDNGTLVRTRVNEVSVIGRNTQGVRLIRTVVGETVVALPRIDEIIEPALPEGENGGIIDAVPSDAPISTDTPEQSTDELDNEGTPDEV